jgi:hypothetical protein
VGIFISGNTVFQVGCLKKKKKIFQLMELRVFENRVLRYKFESKRNEVREGNGEEYITRSIMICTAQLLFG